MPDITLSLTITRTLLSLATLECNDHTNFYVAGQSSPGQVTWARETASSPYVDGDFTVSRRRTQVMEDILFEVRGGVANTQATVQANLATLIQAFTQANFTLTSTYDGTSYAWSCEAADYQVVWDGPRVIAKAPLVRFTVPRSPVPISGPF